MYFVLQSGTEEKEQDQSTQSLDLGFPDDDDDGPQPEGKQSNLQITVVRREYIQQPHTSLCSH